jgi:hypothetical protein
MGLLHLNRKARLCCERVKGQTLSGKAKRFHALQILVPSRLAKGVCLRRGYLETENEQGARLWHFRRCIFRGQAVSRGESAVGQRPVLATGQRASIG